MIREATLQELIVSIYVQKPSENFRLLYLVITRSDMYTFSLTTKLQVSYYIPTNRQ